MNPKEIQSVVGTIIASLGGGAFFIFMFSSWLGKIWAKRILTKEIEELRSKYKLIEAEHSVKFSTLHARRAEVIIEIYSLLSQVENKARALATPIGEAEDPPREETYITTTDLIYELFTTYDKYRIFLTEETCLKIDIFIEEANRPLAFFRVCKQVNKQDPNQEIPAHQSEMREKFMELWHKVESKVPNARRAVEKEFRKILGVEKKSN